MTGAEVVRAVQSGLDKHQEERGRIWVVGHPRLIDGQWQVLVEPDQWEPTPRYHYYELLSDVEEELSDIEGISVFLTPAPEATYRYEVDGETIEVKRRERILFVSSALWRGLAASYDLEGELQSTISGGKADSPHEPVPNSLLNRFDKAVQQYLEEKKYRETREHAATFQ